MNFNPGLLYIAVEHHVAELREQARAQQLLHQALGLSPVHRVLVLPPNPNNQRRKQTNRTDPEPEAA